DLSAAQLAAVVRVTAKPLPGLAGRTISGGVVDPLFALTGTVVKPGGNVGATWIAPAPGAWTPEDVEAAVLSHDEVYASAGGTDAGSVATVFAALFGRPLDPAGVVYFTNALGAGMSRQTLVRAFQNTDEARLTRVARWFQDEFGWAQPLGALKANPGV